jgi:predicted ATPase/DNA-binding winged helix-turn-helix (wHTH) protein
VQAHSVRFDRYELQPRERRLLADGQPVVLGARAFDVLVSLVERAGSLVTKNELLERVWAGLVVEEANLTVQVSSLRKVLGGELIATVPGRGYRFTGQVQAGAAPAAAAPLAAPTLAGPPLVGRAAETTQIGSALQRPGCVTLVGPAGVGKTSLARAVAQGWPGGALWVDLAPLTEGAQVLEALARALGQPTPEAASALLPALGARLLVLDNAEHLIDAVATVVAGLLAAAPGLALLVTCQLPLSVPGERVQRVEPLALGDEGEGGDGGALALFIERARAADHRFVAGAAQWPLLRAICRQLDGLPLAIEMAAARVPALGLQGLHDALQRRFAVLTRGARTAAERHRTLHAALDWSYALLQPEEQRLFRALGVFAGGFTLDLVAAQDAPGQQDRWALIDMLATLVDRSLVAVDTGEAPRYRLLETMRAYALEQLQAAGELDAARERHAEVLHGLVDRVASGGADQAARDAAAAEHDNLREAQSWATQHRPALAVVMAPKVCAVATFTSWRPEALRWLEATEPGLADPAVEPVQRADWWHERARQKLMSRHADARQVAEHARGLYLALGHAKGSFMAGVAIVRASNASEPALRQLCDELQALHDAHPEWQPRTTAVLQGTLAHEANRRGDFEAALGHRTKEHEAWSRMGAHAAADSADSNIVATLHNLGRHEAALERAGALLARLAGKDNINTAYAISTRVSSLTALGHHDEVRREAARTLATVRRYDMPFVLEYWALMLHREGRFHAAARVVGFVQQTYERLGMRFNEENLANVREVEQAVCAALGEQAWRDGMAAGRLLDDAGLLACLAPDAD